MYSHGILVLAVLSGLLLNVALYALLRFKILMAANPSAIAPGPLMVTMGLVSLVFAAFMLYRLLTRGERAAGQTAVGDFTTFEI